MVHIKRSSNGEWLVLAIVALMLLLIVSSSASAGCISVQATVSGAAPDATAGQIVAP